MVKSRTVLAVPREQPRDMVHPRLCSESARWQLHPTHPATLCLLLPGLTSPFPAQLPWQLHPA